MRLFFFLLCCFVMACSNNNSVDGNKETADYTAANDALETTKAITEPLMFTTNLDNLRLRDEPGTEGKEVARLPLGTKVFDTGEVSDFTTPLKLRGVKFDEPWIKVKTEQGIIGWIYGGGLSYNLDPNNPAAQALMQKRLSGLFGKRLADEVEIYRDNYNNATTSEQFATVYEEGITLRENFVTLLEEKIEVDNEQLPDLFWLDQAMPGYVPALVAEGTIYYLFNDYSDFYQKAKATSGNEDDDMAQLFFEVFNMDSIEHFYPSWFLQTWDYGGHSLLGEGIHLKLITKMDELNSQSTFFANTINDLKNQLIQDITVQESAYWETKDKVIAELTKIIETQPKLLTKEDMVALEARLKMMKEATKNKIEFGARER